MTQYRVNRRVIDLSAIRDNVAAVRRAVGPAPEIMAVVKADAYGHGSVQVAREALKAGASRLAVAIPEEGRELRRAGVAAPILVLGPATPSCALGAAEYGLAQTVCSPEMVEWMEDAAVKAGREVQVHLKLDTGMNRIGARTPEEVGAVLNALSRCPHVRLTGAFTHFADADGESDAFTKQQFHRFEKLCAFLPKGITLHAANSAAVHRMDFAWLDMVRLGISLYGCPPVASQIPLRPAMRWETEVTFVKDIQPGDTVSYGRAFKAKSVMRVATIAAGYGDGYPRAVSGRGCVLAGGRRAPILGRICMDQLMADVTDIPNVRAGDQAVLLGRQGNEEITANELAAWAGTISYEILMGTSSRVTRVYENESQ